MHSISRIGSQYFFVAFMNFLFYDSLVSIILLILHCILHFSFTLSFATVCDLLLFRSKTEPPGTTKEQVIAAKRLYESAFHPDSGEKQNIFGRMSFQVPGGMAVTGALLTFYKYAHPLNVTWFVYNTSCLSFSLT